MSLQTIKILATLFLFGALAACYFGWESHVRADERAKVVAEYNGKIDKQKAEAAKKLADMLAERDVAKTALHELISTLEKDRENKQAQNAADLRTRRAGPRLQFTTQVAGCGGGSGSAQSGETKPASDPVPTVVQLPEPLNGSLLDLAADAQSLSIDYGVLYRYVNNPALVCEVRGAK